MQRLSHQLEGFVAQFDDCIKTRPSRRHFATYVAGQLSDLPHKSTHAIAERAGVSARTLQEFLSIHRWSGMAVRDRVRELIATHHAHADAIGVVDETSFPKKGTKTPGVQRQHSGANGRNENCVVTVHLGYVAGPFHTLVDGDVYLPSTTWRASPERCREAGVPDDLEYRPKWRIALDLAARAVRGGLSLEWLCAGAAHGGEYAFRRGLAELGIPYVVEIPRDTRGWLPSHRTARSVNRLWKRGGPSWEHWGCRDLRAARFRPDEDGAPGEEQWILVTRNARGELNYFLSNAADDTPHATLVYVALSRGNTQQLFLRAKQEAGLDHFEGRRYQGLLRHLVLTSVSLLFLAEQRASETST